MMYRGSYLLSQFTPWLISPNPTISTLLLSLRAPLHTKERTADIALIKYGNSKDFRNTFVRSSSLRALNAVSRSPNRKTRRKPGFFIFLRKGVDSSKQRVLFCYWQVFLKS